jgi:hypothetical protein
MSQNLKTNNQNTDFVFEKFKAELEKNNLTIDYVDSESFIHIDVDGTDLKISLENVRLNYERDSDESHITDLIEAILSYSPHIPDWENAKDHVYIELFPDDFDFEGFIYEKITDDFCKVYVISENERLSWISKDDLKKWNVTEQDLVKQANLNADTLLEKTKISFDLIEDRKLGMIEVERTLLKAALLFASKMKGKLEIDFGFPFYAVIPVRDFCYIFSEKDFDFFASRIGKVVVEEYLNSGYPVTTEVLKFSESGVTAVGKYPTENK